MSTLRDKFDDVKHDLVHSWYFKIWLVLGTVCFCVDIAAMAKFAKKANLTVEERGLGVYVEHPSKIEFPSFGLTTGFRHPTMTFVQGKMTCSHNNMLLSTKGNCPTFGTHTPPPAECVLWTMSGVYASRTPHSFHHGEATIHCTFETQGQLDPHLANQDVYFWIHDPKGFTGGDSERFAAFGPNNRTIIILDKYKITTSKYGTVDDWHLNQQYASSEWHHGRYDITIDLSRMVVLHYQDYDFYDGWMSAASLGGFVFLVYLVFAATMSIISVFLANDSRVVGDSYYRRRTSTQGGQPVVASYGQSSFGTRPQDKTSGAGQSDGENYGI